MPKSRSTGSQKRRQAIEGELIPFAQAPVPKVRRFRLTSARGIRRELSAVYHEFRNGELSADDARTAGFILRTLLESVRVDELESRILALENQSLDSEP
jgi:hypothetical protein